MAIDSPAKRLAAMTVRRVPWLRRFLPSPDGVMTIEDRRQLAWTWRGEAILDIATEGLQGIIVGAPQLFANYGTGPQLKAIVLHNSQLTAERVYHRCL